MSTLQPITLSASETKVFGLIYGAAGGGKTVFSCSSKKRRTFLMDVDQGTLSLKTFPGISKELIHVWTVRTREDFMNGLAYLTTYQSHYDHVVVDTVTELQRIILRELASKNNRMAAKTQDWGEVLTIMETITTFFRNELGGLDRTFLAHETEMSDPDTGRLMWRPNFQGTFKTENEKHFDLIARYTLLDHQQANAVGQMEYITYRFLNCQRDAMIHAKDRSNTLAKYEQPDLDSIYDRIKASAA